MRKVVVLVAVLLLAGGISLAQKSVETFHAYVDSDLCGRLMLGPISQDRIACSQDTLKQGSNPVLVRLENNMVISVNKQKMIKQHVGALVEVTGQLNTQKGKIKLQTVSPIETSQIPKDSPGAQLLDARNFRTSGDRTYEQVRRTLAMMPYLTEFDFISFTMVGNDVILTGWTVRVTNRDVAYRRVESVEGVDNIINNIEVLPLGSMDRNIRFQARARLHQFLSMYFWGSGSDIKIIVKNGDIILLGSVIRQADADLARIQCNTVPGAFQVFNLLRVQPGGQAREKKG